MNTEWLIQYPVWELGKWGGGFLIALISLIHVYIAHFAVGGGLFLVLTEMKGYRENSPAILEYTRKHARFFLLLTMVAGSMTGVGLWFVITLLSPATSSILVHEFVFGWATEWVFFIGEIITLLVYYYTFGKMEKSKHLQVGWLYCIFGWLSLFVINGIITFMLTPGEWLQTGNFWDGFFNPTFLPSLVFRTFMGFMLAGLFGFITSAYIKESEFREKMIRYCSLWLIIPLFVVFASGWWYTNVLPEPQKNMILNHSPEILPMVNAFCWVSAILFLVGIFMAMKGSAQMKKTLAFVLLIFGFMHLSAFEWIREAGRRPYLIHGYLYSNSVLAKDVDKIREQGLLQSARWAPHEPIDASNQLDIGKALFRLQCSPCHSIAGPMNDILPLTAKYSPYGMEAMVDGIGKLNEYMPPFMGHPDEKKALAAYIAQTLHQKQDTEPAAAISVEPLPVDIPAFDAETGEYVLLAWTGSGMKFISDCDSFFSLSQPGIDVYAQLLRRSESPEKVMESVILTFILEGGKTQGKLEPDSDASLFVAKDVPVMPYSDKGDFQPYPLMTIEARSAESGDLIASTKIVAPVSTEMNCKTCHGGSWRVQDRTGISDETASDILSVHDRMHRTDLLSKAKTGKPQSCKDCHSETASQEGKNLNLSSAIHGFHANYLTGKGADTCRSCHPKSETGFTRGFRGIHYDVMIDCTGCHGKIEDHALSLLKAEPNRKIADRLMKHLRARTESDIAPRTPWTNQPDCLSCHIDFEAPETDTASLDRWAKPYHLRTDDMGIYCGACHGSAHALYPATNIYGNDRDNIPPMQHQGEPYPIAANKKCAVCHTVDMEDPVHHPNSLGMFRNTR